MQEKVSSPSNPIEFDLHGEYCSWNLRATITHAEIESRRFNENYYVYFYNNEWYAFSELKKSILKSDLRPLIVVGPNERSKPV